MGKLVDYHRRRKVRIDNLDVQFRIKVARRWLFEEGLSFNSVYFKRTLDPLSLTPTRVSLVPVSVVPVFILTCSVLL